MIRYIFIILILFSCENNEKIAKKQIAKSKDTIIEIKKTVISKKKIKIDKNLVLGKFNYKKDSNFIKVSSKYSPKSIYLNKEVYMSFIKMFDAAKKENIELKILSGTRNFNHQKSIWERKWNKYKSLEPIKRAKKILEFSSMPTTSRHHWGTDLDLNNFNNSYFEKGKGLKEYNWLVKNANNYGFYQVYTSKKNGRTGYNLEKWHWSYLPLASEYLKFYNENITYKDITGFKGSELAKEARMIEDYVNGINIEIKN